MPFPQTYAELQAAGYKYLSQSICKGCDARIEWWVTPSRIKMPFDVMNGPDSLVMPHHATCPSADRFRRPKP